ITVEKNDSWSVVIEDSKGRNALFPLLKCEPKASTQDLIKPQRHKVYREKLCLFIGKRDKS
ncbi:MAG: hypothetical protein IJL84_01660, partial [Paludibacteraceae bacterium]|nr:hypothetical protein [Paludibacteraceae bacterium]